MKLVSRILEGLRLFPPSVLRRWAFVTGALSIPLAFLTITWGDGAMFLVFSVASYVGLLLGTGLPLVVGASLLVCTEGTKQRVVERRAHEGTAASGTLFTGYLVLTLLLMTLVTLFDFCLMIAVNGRTEILLTLPHVLAVTYLITGFLSPVAAMLALAVDDSRINLLAGLGIFCALMFTTGWPRFPVSHPEVAFFGPAHLLSALLFTLAFASQYPFSAEYYVGTWFTPIDLLLPLLVFTLLSVFSYRVSKSLFESNLKLWRATSDIWLSGTKPEGRNEDERTDNVPQLMNSLRMRKRDVEVAALLFVILVPLTGFGYVSFRQSEWTVIVYESPAGGESVQIGTWYYNSFEGVEPAQNVFLSVGCEGRILAGGGTEDNITLNFRSREMSLADLQQLNTSQFEDMFGRGWSHTSSNTRFSTGWQGPIYDGQYVWVLRFLNVGGRTEGTFTVWFQVRIIAL